MGPASCGLTSATQEPSPTFRTSSFCALTKEDILSVSNLAVVLEGHLEQFEVLFAKNLPGSGELLQELSWSLVATQLRDLCLEVYRGPAEDQIS